MVYRGGRGGWQEGGGGKGGGHHETNGRGGGRTGQESEEPGSETAWEAAKGEKHGLGASEFC